MKCSTQAAPRPGKASENRGGYFSTIGAPPLDFLMQEILDKTRKYRFL